MSLLGSPAAPSIRRRLVLGLALGLAFGLVLAATLTYLRARDEANALFDLQLEQTAASIIGMPIAGSASPRGAGGDDGLVVQIWDRNGVRVYLSRSEGDDTARVPARSLPGFATIDTPAGPYRVFSVLAREQLLQVGQPMRVRTELAAKLAASTVLPMLVLAPLIALLVWWVVERGLAPLNRVAAAVGKRTPEQLAPLRASGWPREVLPIVDSLNGLLERLAHALDAQRTFVADAAHELRSPLTALTLQAQLAERAATPEERARALADLRGGLTRATRMVEQLLALAREEPGVPARPLAPVDLGEVVESAVRGLAPLAAARSIGLRVRHGESVSVDGDVDSLATLVGNLVDNAIRYTPSGGQVEASVERQGAQAVVAVRDDGPGIPAGERERVFERFARGTESRAAGSGLGLAIVRRIADRHRATIELQPGLQGRGLAVLVRFPARDPAAGAAPSAP